MSPGGRIKDSDIEAVRERSDIVQVIGEYVPLKKAGREFRGPCPFHHEKDPSFYVNPAKEVYFCHGCREGGGIYNFVMKIEGLDFAEAVEKLADRIGYRLSYDATSAGEIEGRLEKDRLFKLNTSAADFFRYNLAEGRDGSPARAYLEGRGFGSEISAEFSLGYARPGWDTLTDFLKKKGFAEKDMVAVGLARERSGERQGAGRGVYDIFRNRLIFPILDHRGRVVAFGGRQIPGLDDKDGPKYLNTPETPIYRKGHTLYGFYQSRNHIQESREAVVVEGYTDLLALRQAGIMPVVASLGTAITENHFDLMAKFADRVFLAFDADRAGMEAARRVFEFFNRFNLEVFVVSLPPGEDPATLIAKGGAEAFEALKSAAAPLLDFTVERIIGSIDTGTPMGRQKAMQACMPVLSRVSGDEMTIVRHELVRKIASMLEMPEESVGVMVRNALRPPGARARESVASERVGIMGDKVEREALRVLAHSPWALMEQQHLDADLFTDPYNRKIFLILKEFPGCDENVLQVEYDNFLRRQVEAAEDKTLRGRMMELLIASPPACGPDYETTVFDSLVKAYLKRRKQKIETEIRGINKKLEPRKYDHLCGELLELQQLIRDQFPGDYA